MASNPDFVNYICEQLEGLGAVRSRKMFGEYMVYLNDKPVVIICDDRPMVKMLPCLEELLRDRPTHPPLRGGQGPLPPGPGRPGHPSGGGPPGRGGHASA
jgi:TfoX/Sxy family transcriptional regulator of competence genes